jgi:hypothetical protein
MVAIRAPSESMTAREMRILRNGNSDQPGGDANGANQQIQNH